MGREQEGAWQFLRSLLGYDYQKGGTMMMCPVREDALLDREREAMEHYDWEVTMEDVEAVYALIEGAAYIRNYTSPVVPMVLEEAEACFNGDKTPEDTARIIQSRVEIFLGETGT